MSLTLIHNGTPVDLVAARCELGSLVRSFAQPDTLTLRRAVAFDEPGAWQPEDAIGLALDGAVVFDGRIKAAERLASAEREWILYTCRGPAAQADAVPLAREIAGAVTPRLVYNCPPDEELAEAGHVPLPGSHHTLGDIIADLLDSMAGPLAGIIGSGTPGSGYLAAELDALALVPPKVVLCGESVDSALRRLVALAPGFAFWIDPASHVARFFNLRALEHKAVPAVAEAVLRHELRFSTDGAYSACTVVGGHEVVEVVETLAPAWDRGLEADWTSHKAQDEPETYGEVWRRFAAPSPAAEGGELDDGLLGGGAPMALLTIAEAEGHTRGACTRAVAEDANHLLLDTWAREPDPETGGWRPAAVRARFAFRKPRIAARFPAQGHTGSAHARRGLTRELVILEEELGRKSVRGAVAEVLSPTAFKAPFGLAEAAEVAGATIEFNSDGIRHAIASCSAHAASLAEAPQRPIQAGDAFTLWLQDDTAPAEEDGSLSLIEKVAQAALAEVCDEHVSGRVPLAGLDWSLALGQAISFSGTAEPELAELRVPLVEIEHDFAQGRTLLSLATPTPAPLAIPWAAWARAQRRSRDARELRAALARLRRRRRRRGRLDGPIGDPHERDPDGPLRGDGVWTERSGPVLHHIGPGPLHRTLGGTGRYIEWIALDLRGHVLEAGVGTFS